MICKAKRVDKKATLPEYKTLLSAGADLVAIESVTLAHGDTHKFRTGLVFEPPPGYHLKVRQRSGLSTKYPNYIMNNTGVIDEDYRGEVFIPIKNNSPDYMRIKAGDRIAQIMIEPTLHVDFIDADDLSETDRGPGGFGHTGR